MMDNFLFTDSSSGSERSSIGSSSIRRSEGGEQRRMVDITRDKPIKVTVRVVVPVRDHPKVSEKKKCFEHGRTVWCLSGRSRCQKLMLCSSL
jgi:hypothetical protein